MKDGARWGHTLEVDTGKVEADVDAGLDMNVEEGNDLSAAPRDGDVGLDDKLDDKLTKGRK